MNPECEVIGIGDLRYTESVDGGFLHVTLYDADDHDVIVINEDTLPALYERIGQTLAKHGLLPTPPETRNAPRPATDPERDQYDGPDPSLQCR